MARPPLDDPLACWADMKIAALVEMREADDRETFRARLARLRARGKAIKAALQDRARRRVDSGFTRLCTGRMLGARTSGR